MAHSPYKRATRVAEEIYRVIAEVCYGELSDSRLSGIQLTDTDLTDDLRILKVYYYIDGSDEEKREALKGLESAKGYIKRAIATKLDLRLVPDILYYFDETIERAEKLDKILDGLK